MSKIKPDLAPCPFCGSSDLNVVQWIECNGCGAFGPTPGDDGDLSIWNKRESQYTAVDMATAAANGFRDGAASVAGTAQNAKRYEFWRNNASLNPRKMAIILSPCTDPADYDRRIDEAMTGGRVKE